jgi:hypothetical protein
MKTRAPVVRLRVEELEGRVVPSATLSTNWAGYAVSAGAGAVTSVSGSWVVPAVSGTGTAYSSAWVGIDGYNSSTVEQIGTDSDVSNGNPVYYAWYEMYPSPPVNLNLAIRPGDTISASVSYSGGSFLLQITDGSQSFSITKSAPSAQRTSAEWIQEAPSSFSGVLPLANFGTINFSNARATISGTTGPIDGPSWSGQYDSINMVTNTGALKATTSGLTDSGSGSAATSSFSVTWVSSGSGSHHGHGKKQPDAAVTPPSPAASALPLAAPSDIVQLAFQGFRPAAQPAAVVPASVAVFVPAPFSQAGPAPLGGVTSATALVGGSAGQSPVLQASADEGEAAAPAAPLAPRSRPDAAPAPRIEPTPSQGGKDDVPSAEAWNGPASPQERTGAWIAQGDEETTAIGDAQAMLFLLAMCGGLGAERAPERWRRRPLR